MTLLNAWCRPLCAWLPSGATTIFCKPLDTNRQSACPYWNIRADKAPLPHTPARRGFSGQVTFTYSVTDGISLVAASALATLVVAPAGALLVPVNYTFETPFETSIDSDKSTNLLADVRSSDPARKMRLVVKAVIKDPPPSEGNVTVKPDGSYVFVPAKGFFGEQLG